MVREGRDARVQELSYVMRCPRAGFSWHTQAEAALRRRAEIIALIRDALPQIFMARRVRATSCGSAGKGGLDTLGHDDLRGRVDSFNFARCLTSPLSTRRLARA